MAERSAFFDNLKFILIALVVVGHVSGPLVDYSFELKVFWRWIYMFHMPAFLFVGGMFAKKMYTPEKGLRLNVLTFYMAMFLLMYTLLWAEKLLWGQHSQYNIFVVGSIPWYFWAMAVFGASTALVAKVKGGAKVVLPISIALAVVAPFCDRFDDFLVSGRIVAYAPFYYAGYYASISGFSSTVSRLRSRKWPVLLAIGAMVALYLALYCLPKEVTGTMSGLATGHNTYDAMKSFPSCIDACIRFADICIAFIMIGALCLVTPVGQVSFTALGSRTLQVYFFHPFIYYPLEPLGFYEPLIALMPWAGWGCVLLAFALAVVLALPRWPGELFARIKGLMRIDNSA